jgi:ribosomal protein L37AE/L43A
MEDDKKGISQEDAVFREKDEEWIKAKRKELDAQRQKAAVESRKATHWMKCPKCGGDMKEVKLENVKVDQCGECQGVFFDAGELEMLNAKKRSAGFMGKLFG